MLIVGNQRKQINLAPGVQFDEAEHTYTKSGKQLSGVTGRISARLGLKYGGEVVKEKCEAGAYLHKWIQDWINSGSLSSVHPDAVFVKNALEDKYKGDEKYICYSEVLVTDSIGTSSAVDIMVLRPDGTLDLYDIKSGAVKPEYLAWQLGTYAYFCSLMGYKVHACYCAAAKDHLIYRIKPRGTEDIKTLLYGTSGTKGAR